MSHTQFNSKYIVIFCSLHYFLRLLTLCCLAILVIIFWIVLSKPSLLLLNISLIIILSVTPVYNVIIILYYFICRLYICTHTFCKYWKCFIVNRLCWSQYLIRCHEINNLSSVIVIGRIICLKCQYFSTILFLVFLFAFLLHRKCIWVRASRWEETKWCTHEELCIDNKWQGWGGVCKVWDIKGKILIVHFILSMFFSW